MDVKTTPSYKFITWTIDRAIIAPRLGVDLRQYWPYAPFQEMMQVLPFAARASALFLSLLLLTLLICAAPLDLRTLALAGGLFMLPFLVLMAGGVPHPAAVTPAKFALYQVRMLPALAVPVLALAGLAFRKLPPLPRVLGLILMALFMGGYALFGLVTDEQKRNAFEAMVQAGMIAYVFLLALVLRVRRARGAKPSVE